MLATLKETNPKHLAYLHSFLQKQRDFIVRHLQTKRQISYEVQLLGFASFMLPLLISLKKQNKIVDVSHSLLVQEVGVESLLVGSFLRLVDVVEAERLITNKSNYECLERFLVLSTRSLHPSLLLLLFL